METIDKLFLMLTEVNFYMLFIAIITVYFFGAFWYSPILFGKKWASIINPTLDKNSLSKLEWYLPMVVQFIATALLSYTVFIAVRISFSVTLLLIIAFGAWTKSSLLFKFPKLKTFIVVASIELGYFFISVLIILILSNI